jgi:hypothetical protein
MEDTNQVQQEARPAELSVKDLVNIRAVVDTAVRRGAFSAEEVSAVGAVYDKLNAFLNAVQAANADQTSTAEETKV